MKEIHDFLTQEECDVLIELINKNHVPSTVVSQGDEFSVQDKSRTSSTSNLDHSNTLVKSIHEKISKYLGLDIQTEKTFKGNSTSLDNILNHIMIFLAERHMICIA